MNMSLSTGTCIFKLKYLNDGTLALIDQDSTFRIINIEAFKVKGGFKLNLHHEHRILNIVDISLSGKYILVGIPKKSKAALFSIKEKKLKTVIGEHSGTVESVAISDDETYFATGGTDGRSFVYHSLTMTPFIALPPHSDYITSITFTKDSRVIAFGSFDKTITIKNIALMNQAFVLKGHSAAIKKLHFLSSRQLLSADKNGNIIIWNLHKRTILKRLPKMLEEILDIVTSQDERFLFVSTVYGNIGLYDLKSFECVSHTYLKLGGSINSMVIDPKNNLLLCGSKEGELSGHYLFSGEDKLLENIKMRNYKNAYKEIEKNILLTFSPHYEILEEIWKKSLTRAKEYFAKGSQKAGEQILEAFLEVPGKRGIIKKVMREFEEFQTFKRFVKDRKYALAYPLAYKHPLYQETVEYEEMEAVWEQQFNKAKKSILAQEAESKSKEYLTLFTSVSQKAKQITDLYNERKVFMLFRAKLSQKEYSVLFNLVKSHPFLAELKEYKDLKSWGDTIYIKIQQAYKVRDYMSAIKLAQSIKDFPEFKDEIQSLVEHSRVYMALKVALDNGSLDKVYTLLEKNSFLGDLPELRGIDPEWEEILSKIDPFMSIGDIQGVLGLFKSYPYASHKKRHMMAIIKTTYMRQLEDAIKKEEPQNKIVKGCKSIYGIFGNDELLAIIVKNYEKVHNIEIDFSQVHVGDMAMFSINALPLNIFDA